MFHAVGTQDTNPLTKEPGYSKVRVQAWTQSSRILISFLPDVMMGYYPAHVLCPVISVILAEFRNNLQKGQRFPDHLVEY